MGKQIIMADKNLLSLHKISAVSISIDAATIITRPRHVFTSSIDHAIVKRKVIILAIQLMHVSLDHWYSPALVQSSMHEHLQHVFIPEIFFLCRSFLEMLVVGESQIKVIAEVKFLFYYILPQTLKNFLVLRLIDRKIEMFLLEWNELSVFYTKNFLVIKDGHRLDSLNYCEIGLFVNYDDAEHQAELFFAFSLRRIDLLVEFLSSNY